PFMEEEKRRLGTTHQNAGVVLMATVKGDVHDIGKNIVGVVLGCNNYKVVDLGVMVPAERIIDAAIEEGADVIGLSGLITPSLDEMVHVARELERRGVRKPLLIGGATTSRTHTAVKIAPVASFPVIHVLDASKAVPVVGSLLSSEGRVAYADAVRSEYERVRSEYARRSDARNFLSLDQARDNALSVDPAQIAPAPRKPGVHAFDHIDLAMLRNYIDWTPFFLSWELKGRYPAIFDDPVMGSQAKTLFDDATRLLDEIVSSGAFRARAVCGVFPARRDGEDDIIVDGSTTLHFLRQQGKKAQGLPNLSLADFIVDSSGLPDGTSDHIGAFAVCIGDGVDELAARYVRDNDDYSAILVKALADRLAEACAEWLHERVRQDIWGYETQAPSAVSMLLDEQYQGIRPAPGYPACPDHTEKPTLFRLLDAPSSIGISLTESMAMVPASSVSGWYFAHPQATYFAVNGILADQLHDYAARKAMDVADMQRWLAPNLVEGR
ncbi:MAG TPA: methionine synthase, partial [Bacteroidetes bacterium]|nr:methionine synthase [Bacteroidota bacterium]